MLGLATAQRNVAAAILVTSLNFSGTMTLPYVLVASIVLPLILIPTAKRLGDTRARPAAAPACLAAFLTTHSGGIMNMISANDLIGSFTA